MTSAMGQSASRTELPSPLGGRGVGGEGGQQRIPAFNRLQGPQNRLAAETVAMAQHPLNLADPHRHPRQFRRVGIEFDALHALRPDRGKLPGPAQRFRLQHHSMLQVFQRLQAPDTGNCPTHRPDQEPGTRAAAPENPDRRFAPFYGSCWRPRLMATFTACHSASSGSTITGPMRRRIEPASV